MARHNVFPPAAPYRSQSQNMDEAEWSLGLTAPPWTMPGVGEWAPAPGEY